MIILFDQLPMPPSENQCYATDFHTKRRFETKELSEYKSRFQAWSIKRFKEIADLQGKLKWDMADHRQQIRIDAYFFFQYEELFTKPTTSRDRPRRKKMDVSNRIKPLHDCIAAMLGVDDSRFFIGESVPFIRREPGQYVAVRLAYQLIQEESEVLSGIKSGLDKIY
jgi:Holliday junction resolvase RusA-like endonuclease